MSFWTLETKADIGICGFSNSLPNLFKEISLGMLNLLIAEEQAKILHTFTRQTAQWNVEVTSSPNDYESLILVWLEEVLYKLEVENKFLVDAQCMIKELEGKLTCEVQVSWIDSDSVSKNLEIKAVTSHELMIVELSEGESYISDDETIPELVGPAWVGTVIFDI
tara:strand:- start:404 stop:898 length:495 start_codon:yes stop_codon:yes gene_type:complete